MANVKLALLIDADDETYKQDGEFMRSFFKRRRKDIVSKTDDQGCGCCVSMWDVVCTEDAAKEIPKRMITKREVVDAV